MPDPDARWPLNATFGPDGLAIGGVGATELAERFGTPVIVADEEHIRSRCRSFASLFPHPLYAVKAFTARAMLALALEEGLSLLASTGGELAACLAAGAAGDRIVLHGNNKSDDELDAAVAARVRFVNVDNEEELDRLERVASAAGVRQDVLLRVVPGVGAGAHRAIRTGGPGTKFGIPLARVPDAVALAMRLPHVRPVGLHAHIGSQVLDAEPYLREVDVVLDLLADLRTRLGFQAEVVDVGGGFGVAYTDERPFALDRLAPMLLERIHTGAERRGLAPLHTLVEPGRSVVGSAMVTLYRVGTVKEIDGRTLVAVDGGMSDNIRPMLYGARYTVAVAGPPRPGSPAVVDVVGRHCESGDVLAGEVKLPSAVARGDLLAFAATGAYTYTMASNYNRVGRPPVVAVRDGVAAEWLRREDDLDLARLEVSPGVPRPHRRPAARRSDRVEIRPATPRDAASFLDLYRAVAAEGGSIRTERVTGGVRRYRRRLRNAWTDREANLVAIADGKVIGSLGIARDEHLVTRHVATLGMFVADGWRGAGVGTALLSEALRWARSVGVEKVELTVYPDNAPARNLYRRFGFVEEGTLVRHSKKAYGYEDEVLMGLWLGGTGGSRSERERASGSPPERLGGTGGSRSERERASGSPPERLGGTGGSE
jgi:diaminopimelate decarboxylase